jgi:hypothetical protein
MDIVCPVDLLPVYLRGSEMVNYMYAFNDQDVSFQFHLACYIAGDPFRAQSHLAPFQRTAESSGQSAAGSGDNIIKRCGMRFGNIGSYSVMFRDCAVHSEQDRILFLREKSSPQRSLYPLNSYL